MGPWRTVREHLGPGLTRDVALVALAVGVVGASYGAITVSQGFPWWTPTVMSVLVFGGASQFLFTGIVGAGGSAAAAVLAGLLINARHLPFGFVLADVFGAKWYRRLAGSYVLVDEVVAFTLAQSGPEAAAMDLRRCRSLVVHLLAGGLPRRSARRIRHRRHRPLRAGCGVSGHHPGLGAAQPA